MAAWDNPKQQIRQLEQKIVQLNAEQQRLRRELEQRSAAQIRELTQRYEQALRDRDRQRTAAFQAQLKQTQEALLKAQQKQMADLRRHDEQARAQQKQLLDQLAQANAQLRREVDNIREEREQEKTAARLEAERLHYEASQEKLKTAKTPHDFFCPDQFSVIDGQLTKSKNLFDQGLFSAAAATASSAATEFRLLTLQVKQKEDEWERLFRDYAAVILQLYQTAEAFCREQMRSPIAERAISDAERDFWSSRTFAALHDDIKQAHDFVTQVQQIGVTRYLMENRTVNEHTLSTRIRDNYKLRDRLNALIICTRDELFFSDERYAIADALVDALDEQGYTLTQAGYMEENGYENPLLAYELDAHLSDMVRIHVSISPVRVDGVVASNNCLITIEMPRMVEANAYAGIERTWTERAAQALFYVAKQTRVTVIRSDSAQLPAMQAQQQRMTADPEKYVRKLALKY